MQPATSPHLDPAAWPGLMEDIGVDTALVLIRAWMGQQVREHLGPEDIWQEALCMAWRDRDQHEWVDIRRFRAWVLQIAKNRIRDAAEWIRAKKRGGENTPLPLAEFLSQSGNRGGDALPAGSTTPSRVAYQSERATAMQEALEGLPKNLRDVLWMFLFEEQPMPRVATQLGMSLATAKRRFFEASQCYRKLLQEQLGTRIGGSFHKR